MLKWRISCLFNAFMPFQCHSDASLACWALLLTWLLLLKLSAFLEYFFNTRSGGTATETKRYYIAEDVPAYNKKFQKLTLKTDTLSRKCRTETRGKWMVVIDWLSLTYHWMIDWMADHDWFTSIWHFVRLWWIWWLSHWSIMYKRKDCYHILHHDVIFIP